MPSVVGVITLISRRWGNKIGGLIASMPWIAGPILLFFILEQGTAFGIRSVPGILAGVVSLVCFCLSYTYLSRHLSWLPTLLLSYLSYLLPALLFNYVKLHLVAIYAISMGSIALALRVFPNPTNRPTGSRRLPYDLPIRMIVATLFMVAITGLASLLGPTWSGILTPFPIMTSILAVFTHYTQGKNGTIVILRGLVLGLFGFTTFLFLQAFLLVEFSVGWSFFLAFLVNSVMNLLVVKIRIR
ncbi:hypothetical protein GJJ30_13095 [Larkinella terrae]|uniref:Uncharacterized protein n=2 Tax=Larkinella terrae TaxID=2025311 RepID=A0A7K0EK79_9BACT|nr:hypothetical protein [Larkinella terrae]